MMNQGDSFSSVPAIAFSPEMIPAQSQIVPTGTTTTTSTTRSTTKTTSQSPTASSTSNASISTKKEIDPSIQNQTSTFSSQTQNSPNASTDGKSIKINDPLVIVFIVVSSLAGLCVLAAIIVGTRHRLSIRKNRANDDEQGDVIYGMGKDKSSLPKLLQEDYATLYEKETLDRHGSETSLDRQNTCTSRVDQLNEAKMPPKTILISYDKPTLSDQVQSNE